MQLPKEGIKKHNKNRHKANKRITEYIKCEVCGKLPAVETHEIWGGSSRNKCMENKWQVKICRTCHNDSNIKKNLKIEWQAKLMKWFDWSEKDIINEVGKYEI